MRLNHIIIQCDDVERQRNFWEAALGSGGGFTEDAEFWIRDRNEEVSTIGRAMADGYGQRPRSTCLRFVPDRGTVVEETARLVALGATVIRKYHNGWGFGEVVLADPEGNEFLLESDDEDSVVEARLAEGRREDGGPFWADAVPPEPLARTVIGTAYARTADTDDPQSPGRTGDSG